jgi:hypothetical protein
MATAGGGHYLLACFSAPGKAQPTIAVSGATTNVSYGCVKSAEVASVPVEALSTSRSGVRRFTQAVRLPNNKKCVSRRVFQIRLQDPKYDPLKQVVVTLRGRRVAVVRRSKVFASRIDLRGLPRGIFTIQIYATTVLGHHLYGHRTYHTCIQKLAHSGKPKPLHPIPRRHG